MSHSSSKKPKPRTCGDDLFDRLHNTRQIDSTQLATRLRAVEDSTKTYQLVRNERLTRAAASAAVLSAKAKMIFEKGMVAGLCACRRDIERMS